MRALAPATASALSALRRVVVSGHRERVGHLARLGVKVADPRVGPRQRTGMRIDRRSSERRPAPAARRRPTFPLEHAAAAAHADRCEQSRRRNLFARLGAPPAPREEEPAAPLRARAPVCGTAGAEVETSSRRWLLPLRLPSGSRPSRGRDGRAVAGRGRPTARDRARRTAWWSSPTRVRSRRSRPASPRRSGRGTLRAGAAAGTGDRRRGAARGLRSYGMKQVPPDQ